MNARRDGRPERQQAREGALVRVARLGRSNWVVLTEASACVALASLAIRLLPFRRTAAVMAHAPSISEPDAATRDKSIARCCWAVRAFAARVPWRALCFERGLALHLMLRRRGIVSVLHYGVAQDGAEGLRAHVWVEAGGRLVMGGENAADFQRVASFPAPHRA